MKKKKRKKINKNPQKMRIFSFIFLQSQNKNDIIKKLFKTALINNKFKNYVDINIEICYSNTCRVFSSAGRASA